MRKWFFLILVFLSTSFAYSQEDALASIQNIRFKDATYSSGSGVSVHFDPKGIYKLGDESNLGFNDADNNAFILELSDLGGETYVNPIQLETLYDFYTPLINSNLPSNLTPGTYRLRIRATLGYNGDPNGWSLESDDYAEVVAETPAFLVQNQNITSEISITLNLDSAIISNNN